MRNISLILFIFGGVLFVTIMTNCAAPVANTNTNVRNANSNNTAILVNTNSIPTNANRSNANITREEYDRDRAEYERDKGSSTIGQGIDDSWIWFKTRTALAAADDLRDSTINVDVVDAVITLKGTVGSAAQKTQAENVAKSIDRNKGVKNQLTVRAGDSMTNQMVNGNSSNSNRR